jgi:hypothetical protein
MWEKCGKNVKIVKVRQKGRAELKFCPQPHVSNFDWTVVWQVVRRDGDQVGPGGGNTGDA